jgi:hypothetical protein
MKMPKAVKGIVESIQSTAINKQPLALQLPSSSILILIISIFSSVFSLMKSPKLSPYGVFTGQVSLQSM